MLWLVDPTIPPITEAADRESKNFASPSFCSLLKEYFIEFNLYLFFVAVTKGAQLRSAMRLSVIAIDDGEFIVAKTGF